MSTYGIQRKKIPILLAYQTNATTATQAGVSLNGLLRGVEINAPDLDSTNTYTITLTDSDGFDIYTKGKLAKNTRSSAFIDANNQPLQLPLSGAYTVKIVTSGNQTADRSFSVSLLVDRG